MTYKITHTNQLLAKIPPKTAVLHILYAEINFVTLIKSMTYEKYSIKSVTYISPKLGARCEDMPLRPHLPPLLPKKYLFNQ